VKGFSLEENAMLIHHLALNRVAAGADYYFKISLGLVSAGGLTSADEQARS